MRKAYHKNGKSKVGKYVEKELQVLVLFDFGRIQKRCVVRVDNKHNMSHITRISAIYHRQVAIPILHILGIVNLKRQNSSLI